MKERERRKELKLGNAWAMESVGGERRDSNSSTISSWRVSEASKISHKSKRSYLENTFTLAKKLAKSSKNSC